jgi:hypothetical protein
MFSFSRLFTSNAYNTKDLKSKKIGRKEGRKEG